MPAKLRRVSLAAQNDGYVLTDPYGLTDQAIWLGRPALAIATLLGDHPTLEALQAHLVTVARVDVPLVQLQRLVDVLDEAGFLDTPQARARLSAAEQAFLAPGLRPMVLADRSYPREKAAFMRFVAELKSLAPPDAGRGPLTGLVLPHLEITRAPAVYGAALGALADTPAPQRVLLVGVAHSAIDELAAAIALDLETPLGRLSLAAAELEALVLELPFKLLNAPLAFRQEHSIEFPASLLHAVWPEASIEVLPMVVGGVTKAEDLVDLMAALAKRGDCFPVASVDLSHVGARFGDPALDEAAIARTRRTDQAYLAALAAGTFARAFEEVNQDQNPTRIDAVASVQALSPLLQGVGEVLGYELSIEPGGESAVGAGAVAFYSREPAR